MKTKTTIFILLILSAFSGPAFGAKEIQFAYDDGFNPYALVRRSSDGHIWDVGDSQFEAVGTWNDARAGECDIGLTGYDAELYMADFPAAAAGRYLINIYLRAGANPAITDTLLSVGEIVWNSAAEKTIIDTSGRVDVGAIEGSDATDVINAEADTALTDYDPPTKAELDTGLAGLNDPTAAVIVDAVWEELIADHIGAGSFGAKNHKLVPSESINDYKADVSAVALEANVEGHVTTSLGAYDSPTKAELDSGLAGLNDPTAAAVADTVWDELIADHTGAGSFGAKNQKLVPSETINDYKADVSAVALEANVEGHVTTSLGAYDPPTKAELDSGLAGLNDPTAAAVADAVWDELIADHTGAGSFGAKNQKLIPSETINDYKADVSAVALEANVEGHITTALGTYDPPTKAELDSGLAGLNDPTAAAVADAVWDELAADHTGAGSFGAKNQKLVPSETINDYKADVSALALEANVEGHVTTALDTYDPPTKAELDSGFAELDYPTAAVITDFIWDELTADHEVAGSFGAKNQNKVPSETINDYKADVSTVALEANVEGHITTALNTYDPPTKAELDSGLAGLNDPTAQAVVDALMADTGITAGGTWTFEEWCKAVGAYLIGTWRDKSGEGTSIQEILDAEDDVTVILELSAGETSPYKTTSKK